MKSYLAVLALAATVIAGNTKSGGTCNNGQVVVCKSNGNGGTLSLGNIAPGLLGQSCSGGNVYCCSEKDVKQRGLVNLDLNAQCSLNQVL